jgi:cysteine desulfurase
LTDTIYLDHAATTPMAPEVIDVMTTALQENYGNASSVHKLGKKNRVLIDYARKTMADSIQADPREIVITSGGTESDNMAVIKTAEHYAKKGKHIITTNVEHPAVGNPMRYLEANGFDVTYLPVDEKGRISVEQVKEALRPDTILVSVMYGNNEVGTIMPIQEIGEYLDSLEQTIAFHTDAVQAYGTVPLDVQELKVDLLSVSAHKMKGPKGIGFLYVREGLNIPNLLLGGGQENERRAGTENIPAILAFEKAIQLNQEKQADQLKHFTKLKERFIELLEESSIEYSLNGDLKHALSHILSVNLPAMRSDLMLIQMDLRGIAMSAGSACSAGTIEPSHVLVAMFGEEAVEIDHTVRFSFGIDNTVAEIEHVVEILENITVK